MTGIKELMNDIIKLTGTYRI